MSTFDAEPELQELTLNEIFNGCTSFEGFCPVVCRLLLRRCLPGLRSRTHDDKRQMTIIDLVSQVS